MHTASRVYVPENLYTWTAVCIGPIRS